MNLKAILEGLLFLSGDDGLKPEQIKGILDINDNSLKALIVDLQNDYLSDNRGIKLDTLGNRLKLVTKKEHKEYYQKLYESASHEMLSQAALETLAIVAYNSPITRMQVDEVRGVDSSHMLRKLVARNLIEEKGRSELPGRPILYGITDYFLDYFGLSSIEDLPDISSNQIIDDEKDLYHSRYIESN